MKIVTYKKFMAEILQDQFISVFSDPENPESKLPNFENPKIQRASEQYDFTISSSDIISAINDIKSDAASGPNGVPDAVLKACANELSEPIRSIWSCTRVLQIELHRSTV